MKVIVAGPIEIGGGVWLVVVSTDFSTKESWFYKSENAAAYIETLRSCASLGAGYLPINFEVIAPRPADWKAPDLQPQRLSFVRREIVQLCKRTGKRLEWVMDVFR